jgi:hypothetical protein
VKDFLETASTRLEHTNFFHKRRWALELLQKKSTNCLYLYFDQFLFKNAILGTDDDYNSPFLDKPEGVKTVKFYTFTNTYTCDFCGLDKQEGWIFSDGTDSLFYCISCTVYN